MYALVAVPSSVGGSAFTCLIATIGGSYRATLVFVVEQLYQIASHGPPFTS